MKNVVEKTEEMNPVAEEKKPAHEPLPDPEAEMMAAAMEGPMIDEGLLEHTCHQLFELYQKTGNHEVRRLSMLVAQMGAAILGADPREFFPEATPIRDDSNGPVGAPTFPVGTRQSWMAPGFTPTQLPVDAYGRPLPGYGHQPMAVPMPRANPGQIHQNNPSGAEMRIVSDPGGTMMGQPVNPEYVPPMPGMPGMPQQQQPQQQPYPRRRRS